MQDLIQLGITTPGGPDLGSSVVEGRSPLRARHGDPLGESLGFDTLLALAASLHRPPTSIPLDPVVAEAGIGIVAGPLEGVTAQDSTSQVEQTFDPAPAGTEPGTDIPRRHAQIHDLFTGLTSQLGSSEPAQEDLTLKKHQALSTPASTGADTGTGDATLPIEFRPTRRVIPIHVERQAEPLRSPEQPREIKTGSNGPDLRIVARNDHPEPTPTNNDVLPITRRLPDLRLVVSNAPQGEINTDLVDRLAHAWRRPYTDDGIDLSGLDATGTAPSEVTQAGPPGAGIESEGGSHFSGDSSDGAGQPRAVEHQPAPVVPLFGDLMSASRVDGESPLDLEQTVDVRRAVVEISREVQRLESMGGSELSFSLRLHPEHLGQIEVDIQRSGNSWTVSITTADEGARHALAAEMHRLENAFRDHNLNLDRLTIVARAPEPVINAPDPASQTANPDWQGAGSQDFMGNENQDKGRWQGYGRQAIIGIDSSRDVGVEQEVTNSHTEASRSGIDIHI